MSLVKKCYHCKVIEDLTNTKLVALQEEYDNLQHYLQTKEDLGLYSANKQQPNRFYKVIKKRPLLLVTEKTRDKESDRYNQEDRKS